MPECSKCGYKTSKDMNFCPKCGASLRNQQAPSEPRAPTPTRSRDEKAEKYEKHEKHEKREKTEKHEKGEYAFIGPLIGGLILIIVGLMSYLHITGAIDEWSMQILGAVLIIIIGIVIILVAFYASMTARKRSPAT